MAIDRIPPAGARQTAEPLLAEHQNVGEELKARVVQQALTEPQAVGPLVRGGRENYRFYG